jgi:hypothetical protein
MQYNTAMPSNRARQKPENIMSSKKIIVTFEDGSTLSVLAVRTMHPVTYGIPGTLARKQASGKKYIRLEIEGERIGGLWVSLRHAVENLRNFAF